MVCMPMLWDFPRNLPIKHIIMHNMSGVAGGNLKSSWQGKLQPDFNPILVCILAIYNFDAKITLQYNASFPACYYNIKKGLSNTRYPYASNFLKSHLKLQSIQSRMCQKSMKCDNLNLLSNSIGHRLAVFAAVRTSLSRM